MFIASVLLFVSDFRKRYAPLHGHELGSNVSPSIYLADKKQLRQPPFKSTSGESMRNRLNASH